MAENDNSPKQKIGTPKSKDAYRQAWDAAMGQPSRPQSKASELMKVPELVRALEHMFGSTGDPIFADALAAVTSYGFEKHGLKRGGDRAEALTFGDLDEGYLAQIRFMVERRGWTVPVATQEVVARFRVPGQSFDTVTHELARRYRAWVAAGFPSPNIDDVGDLGYSWLVFPINDETLNLGRIVIPPEGLTVKATGFWRRLLRDGSIRVQRVP